MKIRITQSLLFLVVTNLFVFSCTTPKQSKETEKSPKKSYKTIGSIERIDPKINDLIPEEAVIEVLGTNMVWSEGPLWIPEKKWLLCSDVAENRTHRWSEDGGFEVYLEPSGFTGDSTDSREQGANGLILDPNGNLVLCQHGDRRVVRMLSSLDNPKPEFETIAGDYEGKRLNSPNDLIYDSKGNLYFTDPPFGLSEALVDDPKKELPYQGVFRYSADGNLTLLTDEMSRPNGLALSPDEKTLYVSNADSEKAIWMAYPLNEDGTLGTGKIFYDATELTATEVGLPDGLKVDKEGNIYSAGPGGLWVFDPTGKVLGRVQPGEWVSNCAFDENESTLYITADDYLLRVRL